MPAAREPIPARRGRPKPSLGVVGGMGPLASAELVRTIYRLHVREPEQLAPSVVLHSDPSIPDRTEAIAAGREEELAARLEEAVEAVLAAGAQRVVIACVTIHRVLPRLPARLRERVISLVDLTVKAVIADPRPRLLLATDGTRASGVFEAHPRWGEAAASLAVPQPDDQRTLHDRLYRLKAQAPPEEFAGWLDTLAAGYGVAGFVFACTELHLLDPVLGRRGGAWPAGVIDPLRIVAERAPELAADGLVAD